MSITIENPVAEEIIAALKRQIPPSEYARMKTILIEEPPYGEDPTYSGEWSEEDLRDFSAAGAALYEEIEAEEIKNAQGR